MKYNYKKHTTISLIISCVIYLIGAFIFLDLTWVTDCLNSIASRSFSIFIYSLIQFYIFLFNKDLLNKD